jgi:4-amino-4-deoxychorismate lyase
LDEQAWRSLIATAGRAWTTPGEAALKLVLTRGVGAVATGFLTITTLSADYARLRRDGLHVISLSRGTNADSFAGAPWLLGGVKTLSYAVNMAAMRVAEQRGADDVIFVTADGAVLESPTSSVLWSLGRSLHTIPTGENGILAGTTQERLFGNAAAAGWDVSPRSATIAELHACEGLWLISSVRGPIEVVSLDRVAHVRHPQIHAEICQLSGF